MIRKVIVTALSVALFTTAAIASKKTVFMFVQSASAGSLEEISGKPGAFLLTLTGVSPSTVYFSDRPARISGQSQTGKFLEGLPFSEDNPPNAAIQATADDGSSRIAVVTLLSPRYDSASATLKYEVRPLAPEKMPPRLSKMSRRVGQLPGTFRNVALFIDDCPNVTPYAKCFLARLENQAGAFRHIGATSYQCVDGGLCGKTKKMPQCNDYRADKCDHCGWQTESKVCSEQFRDCCARSDRHCPECITREIPPTRPVK